MTYLTIPGSEDDSSSCPGGLRLRIATQFDAAYSEEEGTFHLLLEDLSPSHFQVEWPLPPSERQCQLAVDRLAALHTFWWNDLRLTNEFASRPASATIERTFKDGEEALSRFLNFLGDRLSQNRRAVYEKVFASEPALTQALSPDGAVTLIHGDAHFWNFLFSSRVEQPRIIDWETWHVGLGAMDIAYMIALRWYPERRARFEIPLLHRYHSYLVSHGIADYDWDSCWHHYRTSVIHHLLFPMLFWNMRLPVFIWWDQLECSFLAFEDLHCSELL